MDHGQKPLEKAWHKLKVHVWQNATYTSTWGRGLVHYITEKYVDVVH
jgi:hypothetical protein